MIRLGMVESWSPAGSRAPTRRATYDAAEAKAKQSKTGLWSACGMIGR
jgi:endonuclease YncB( thermonuclease family)